MTEELQLFLEDMDEQLGIMENTLLDMSDIPLSQIDKEMINNLFRAMHTMKGNAGIFDYKTIVSFAHQAESLLDEVRNDKILLTEEMIELFLLINDHSKILIDVTIKNETFDEKQQEQHDYLLEQLSSYLNNDNQEENITNSVNKNQEEKFTKYEINIKLLKDFFKSGMDMLSIINYLDAIGSVIDIKLDEEDIPSFDEIEPLNAYVKLKFIYETSEPLEEIFDAFEFVQEDIELKIDEIDEVLEFVVEEEPKSLEVIEKEIPKEVKKENEQKNSISNNFTLKVDSSKVDKLINQMSELVIANAKITQYALNSGNPELEEAVVDMSEILEDVRNGVMNIRMVQVSDSFSKLRRIVTEASKTTNKDIGFEILGGETELDKTVIEKIADPLVHLLRNSVDHGIETPEERKQKGKNPKGSIILKAYHDSGTIVIEIKDDGAGINKETVLNKAIERNLVKPTDVLSDKEIYNLIFMAGFSTAEKISDISGRGVGMDVVKSNIQDLRGRVNVYSELGEGTTIKIRLPLTLAIIDGFLVESANSKYIIPLDSIKECIEFSPILKKQMEQNGYITLRSNILPILDISTHFGDEDIKKSRKNIVVVKYGNQQVGLKVDDLHGEFQTVIKPLGDVFKNVTDISGGTILGDGDIALILDIQKLIEHKITYKESEDGN